MGYLGNSNTTQTFVSGTDYFNGNGSTVTFTLSRYVVSPNDIEVYVNNVAQDPSSAYTVLNNTITFTGTPSSGTNNIIVRYLTTTTLSLTPSAGTVTTAAVDVSSSGFGAFKLPTGTTGQRPGGITGLIRFNTTTTQFEGHNGTAWTSIGGAALGGISGSTPNYVFFENDTIITANYTVTTGKNAMTAGPVTIQDGITVTVPDGSVWTIV